MESRVSTTIRLSPASHKHQQNITHREGPNREKLWNKTSNQIKYCPSISFLQEVFYWNMNERTLFRQFAVHFVFVSFSYRDLYVTSIIQMPHTLNIKCGRRQIFVMKYRISTNMRDTHLTQETAWSRKGKVHKWWIVQCHQGGVYHHFI